MKVEIGYFSRINLIFLLSIMNLVVLQFLQFAHFPPLCLVLGNGGNCAAPLPKK